MNTPRLVGAFLGSLILFTTTLSAQVPSLVNYQGRVGVGSPAVNFDGSGQFKFALVNANGSTTYWSNDGSSVAGSEPALAVARPVTKGLYAVALGDTTLTNMTAVPASVFDNADVRLRVWFNDGPHGFQLLTPDQRIASVGFAMKAQNATSAATALTVPDGAITGAKLGTGSVGNTQLANGAVTTAKLAAGTTSAPQGVASTQQGAAANTNYVATGSAQTAFALPATANVGDVIQLTGAGTGGWQTSIFDFSVWTPQESSRGWNAVASSANGEVLVATVSNGRIYVSSDSGLTWIPRENVRLWTGVAASADGSKLVATVFGGQIYTSTNFGQTWTARESSRIWASVASSADGVKLVAPASSDQIYTSVDSGVNWTARESSRGWTAVASSADGAKLVAAAGPDQQSGQIYTSTDSGVNWTPRITVGGSYWSSLASSADGTKLVATTRGLRIFTSTDSGVTWTARGVNRAWVGVASSADGTKLAAVEEGGQIYTSADSGANWTARESNRPWAAVASSSDGTKLAAVVNAGQVYTSDSRFSGGQASTVSLQYLGDGRWGTVRIEATEIGAGSVNNTEFGYLDGVTSSLQTQLAGKLSLTGGLLTGPLAVQTATSDASATATFRLQANGGHDWQLRSITGFGGQSPAGALRFVDNTTSVTALTILGDGKAGFGRVPTFNGLEVEGSASKMFAGDWASNSDRRIKLDIRTLDHALETLDRVRLVDFRYTPEYRSAHPGIVDRRYLNVIAQEFAEVFPEHVTSSGEKLPDGSEILQVDTYPLTIYSAAAVQELHGKLKEKDAEIAALKAQLAAQAEKDRAIEARLSRLEEELPSPRPTARKVILTK